MTTSWLASYAEPSKVVTKKAVSGYNDPPAFDSDIILSTKKNANKDAAGPSAVEWDELKVKKAWDIAMGPSKSLPMNAIMSYFSGSSLQIFSLTMTFMLFSNPVKSIASIGSTFARFESESTYSRILQAKVVFILMQLATVAVGVWKMSSMGVLPTKRSDWLAWESEVPALERSVFIS
ncbi:uncharacterized protein V1518DRAFT_426700 [Limtongia smithiae]|uniref:uncharacterized protein n=1 Tax=Limtongia smithiae TaxID=1125753 RepID=UPI0034CE4ADD